MRSFGLIPKMLSMVVGLFGVTILVIAAFQSWSIDRSLTAEFQRDGENIAKSIASSSVDLLANQDPTAIQAMIDERWDGISGVSYILVLDEHENVVAHTFVPAVPDAVRRLPVQTHQVAFAQVHLDGLGDSIDVSSSILHGQGGYVHVGMDREPIQARIWQRNWQLAGLLSLLFAVSALATFGLMRKITPRLLSSPSWATGRKICSGDRPSTSSIPMTSRESRQTSRSR